VNTIDNRLEEMQELQEIERIEQEAGLKTSPQMDSSNHMSGSFMSESVYGKLNSPQARKRRAMSNGLVMLMLISGRMATPVLQKHLGHGTNIRTFQGHNDPITAMDFDLPFGTLVTASLDSTLRVWDLSYGRCQGQLEGHNGNHFLPHV
jgi:mitochondrial division protein 1